MDNFITTPTETFTMSQASQALGISSLKIRRYCNAGLVPGIRYTIGRHRSFTPEQIDWLKTLNFLSQAGFSTKDLHKYTWLERQGGDEAWQEQRAMLSTHRRQVWQKLEDLQAAIAFIERQEELHDQETHHE